MYSGKNIESGYDAATLGAPVQSDRVHTSLYTSGDIFALEIEKIFNQTSGLGRTRKRSPGRGQL